MSNAIKKPYLATVVDFSDDPNYTKDVELPANYSCNPSKYFNFVFQDVRVVDGTKETACSYFFEDMVLSEPDVEKRLEVLNIKQKEKLAKNLKDVLVSGIQYSDSKYQSNVGWREDAPIKVFGTKEDVQKYFESLGFNEVEKFSYSSIISYKEDGSLDLNNTYTVFIPKGVKVGTVYFVPACRFSTVNKTAKQQYAFVYHSPETERLDIMSESHYLCVLDKPDLVVSL